MRRSLSEVSGSNDEYIRQSLGRRDISTPYRSSPEYSIADRSFTMFGVGKGCILTLHMISRPETQMIPRQYRAMVHYQQIYVLNRPDEDGGPFLTHEIRRLAKKEDYILSKLDMYSPGVDEGNIDYLLT